MISYIFASCCKTVLYCILMHIQNILRNKGRLRAMWDLTFSWWWWWWWSSGLWHPAVIDWHHNPEHQLYFIISECTWTWPWGPKHVATAIIKILLFNITLNYEINCSAWKKIQNELPLPALSSYSEVVWGLAELLIIL